MSSSAQSGETKKHFFWGGEFKNFFTRQGEFKNTTKMVLQEVFVESFYQKIHRRFHNMCVPPRFFGLSRGEFKTP
jgi:hypothetical protein